MLGRLSAFPATSPAASEVEPRIVEKGIGGKRSSEAFRETPFGISSTSQQVTVQRHFPQHTTHNTGHAKPTMVSPRTRASGLLPIPVVTGIIKAVAFLLFLGFVTLWNKYRPDVGRLHAEAPTAPAAAASANSGDGFHPIHVYYGPEDAVKRLRSSSSEMQQNYNAGSQVDQDKIIIALTKLYRTKSKQPSSDHPYFIDLAANDAVQLSNTLRLEDDGWRGLCVEPNPIYWYRLAHRKCDVVGAFVGGQTDMQQVDVSLTNEEYGGIVGDQMDNKKNVGNKKERGNNVPKMEKRYTVSLRSIFRKFDVPPTIDYLSLDVEGAEELIMEDFPYDAHKILFITIERPKPGLKTLLEVNGYRFVMMLIVWGETLWVHESVLDDLSMSEIEQTVRSTSDYPGRKPRKGQMVFNIETGEYLKNER